MRFADGWGERERERGTEAEERESDSQTDMGSFLFLSDPLTDLREKE